MQRFLFRLFTLCLLCALPAPAQFGIFKPSKPATKPTPDDPLAGHASKQPDKELFDKAMVAMKKGKFDVARLDLQTLLNTYPESEYQMRAKLAVGFRIGIQECLQIQPGDVKLALLHGHHGFVEELLIGLLGRVAGERVVGRRLGRRFGRLEDAELSGRGERAK